jgi:hypothetical protein
VSFHSGRGSDTLGSSLSKRSASLGAGSFSKRSEKKASADAGESFARAMSHIGNHTPLEPITEDMRERGGTDASQLSDDLSDLDCISVDTDNSSVYETGDGRTDDYNDGDDTGKTSSPALQSKLSFSLYTQHADKDGFCDPSEMENKISIFLGKRPLKPADVPVPALELPIIPDSSSPATPPKTIMKPMDLSPPALFTNFSVFDKDAAPPVTKHEGPRVPSPQRRQDTLVYQDMKNEILGYAGLDGSFEPSTATERTVLSMPERLNPWHSADSRNTAGNRASMGGIQREFKELDNLAIPTFEQFERTASSAQREKPEVQYLSAGGAADNYAPNPNASVAGSSATSSSSLAPARSRILSTRAVGIYADTTALRTPYQASSPGVAASVEAYQDSLTALEGILESEAGTDAADPTAIRVRPLVLQARDPLNITSGGFPARDRSSIAGGTSSAASVAGSATSSASEPSMSAPGIGLTYLDSAAVRDARIVASLAADVAAAPKFLSGNTTYAGVAPLALAGYSTNDMAQRSSLPSISQADIEDEVRALRMEFLKVGLRDRLQFSDALTITDADPTAKSVAAGQFYSTGGSTSGQTADIVRSKSSPEGRTLLAPLLQIHRGVDSGMISHFNARSNPSTAENEFAGLFRKNPSVTDAEEGIAHDEMATTGQFKYDALQRMADAILEPTLLEQGFILTSAADDPTQPLSTRRASVHARIEAKASSSGQDLNTSVDVDAMIAREIAAEKSTADMLNALRGKNFAMGPLSTLVGIVPSDIPPTELDEEIHAVMAAVFSGVQDYVHHEEVDPEAENAEYYGGLAHPEGRAAGYDWTAAQQNELAESGQKMIAEYNEGGNRDTQQEEYAPYNDAFQGQEYHELEAAVEGQYAPDEAYYAADGSYVEGVYGAGEEYAVEDPNAAYTLQPQTEVIHFMMDRLYSGLKDEGESSPISSSAAANAAAATLSLRLGGTGSPAMPQTSTASPAVARLTSLFLGDGVSTNMAMSQMSPSSPMHMNATTRSNLASSGKNTASPVPDWVKDRVKQFR